MFVHCNLKFRADETMFLFDKDNFIKRKLKVGRCPVCGKLVARLIETRVQDNKVFDTFYYKQKAEQIIEKLIDEVNYSSLDALPKDGTLYGFRYGENKERINKKTGKCIITQKACDFFGNKEIVKKTSK